MEHTIKLGQQLRSGLDASAKAHGFGLDQTGPVQMPMVQVKDDPDFRFSMSFASGMMRSGGYLYPQHNLFLCAAMTQADIEETLDKADRVFADRANRRSQIEPHAPLMKVLGRAR